MTAARAFGVAAATLLAAASAAGAQGSVYPQPISPPAPAFKFPHIKTHILPNGLRLLVAEDHSAPVVSVRLVLGADSTRDPAGKEGLTAVMLGALRDGTTNATAEQIAQRSMAIGTAVSPTSFTTTSEAFAPALSLMSDMLMHPTFDQASIDRRKAAQVTRARNGAQSPSAPARRVFFGHLHDGDDVVTRAMFPTEAAASAITRDDVMSYYRNYVSPATATMIVAGDVSDARAFAAATSAFGAWKGARAPQPARVERNAVHRGATIYLCNVPGTVGYMYVGNAGPYRDSPDAPVVELLGAIANRRFVQSLREAHSFIYSGTVGVAWQGPDRPSDFIGSTNVMPTKADSALTAWLDVLRGVRGEAPIAPAELEAAKRLLVGALPGRLDGPDALANTLVEMVRNREPLDHFDRLAAAVSLASAADVTAAAAKYIDMNNLIIVVTGDIKVIEPALRAANLAPIVVVDQTGKRLR